MATAAASRSLLARLLAARAALRAPASVCGGAGGRTSVAFDLGLAARRFASAAGSWGDGTSPRSLGVGYLSCYRPDEKQLAFHEAEYRDGLLDHAKYLFEGSEYQGERPWCGPIGEDGLPTWVDWRLCGAVTPVQDQLVWGPCWAFAAIEAMQIEHFLARGELLELSVQHLLDGNDVLNDGFLGGHVPEAYHYILREQHGIALAADYPYVARPMPIKRGGSKPLELDLVTITGYGSAIGEAHLKKAVSKRGVTAGLCISPHWKKYQGGIIKDFECELRETMHAVTVVAYGTSRSKEDFFIIKDSFGEIGPYGGYIYLSRGLFPECGTLGLATFGWFPTKIAKPKVDPVWKKVIKSETMLGIKKKPFKEIHHYLGLEEEEED